jgi:rubrerythrin
MPDELFSTLKNKAEYLRKMYAAYARLTEDEGFRKFLNSMAEQERSHRQYLEEEVREAGEQARQAFSEVLSNCEVPEGELDVGSYSRTDFLGYAMEMERSLLELYDALSQAAPSEELTTFFHSMYIEEKRHHGLVKDRYELESLLSS